MEGSFRYTYDVYDLKTVVKIGDFSDVCKCVGKAQIIANNKDILYYQGNAWEKTGQVIVRGTHPNHTKLPVATPTRQYVLREQRFYVYFNKTRINIKNLSEYDSCFVQKDEPMEI